MKIFQKKKKDGLRKGAITVFLTVILVPCLVFASVFTDLSRVELAKAQAVSAADLSLNTVLAHYDPDLKEFYGMMASVQSPEEFMKKAEKYFSAMLKQNGVDDAQTGLFIDAVRNLFQGEKGKTSNFLQMSLSEEPTITAAENGKLTNPVLIEDQIVEFMKYRGIPVIVEKLLDRFNVFSNQTKEVEEAEEYEPTANAKQEYAKAEGELMEAIFNTYFVLYKYQQIAVAYEELIETPTHELATHFESLESDVNKIWNDFKKANELATLRYVATDGVKALKLRPNTDYDIKGDSEKKAVKDSITSEEDGKYYITQSDYDQIMDEYKKAYDALSETTDKISQRLGELNKKLPSNGDINEAIYAIEAQRALTENGTTLDDKLESQVKDLVEVTKKLEVIHQFSLHDGEKIEYDPEYRDWQDEVKKKKGAANKLLRSLSSDNTSTYQLATSKYNNLVYNPGVVDKIIGRNYTFTSEFMGGEATLEEFTKKVSERYAKEIDYLSTMITYIDVVIDGGKIEIDGNTKKLKPIQKLRELIDNYVNTKNKWSKEANSIRGNEHGEKDLVELGEIEANKNDTETVENKISQLEKSITLESLNELKQRLQNSRKLLEAAKEALEKQMYGDKKLADVSSGEEFISITKGKVGSDTTKITMSISDGKQYAAQFNEQLVKPSKDELYKKRDISRTVSGNDPDLENINPTDHIPPLYKELQKHFKNIDQLEKDVDKYQKQNEGFSKQGEEQKKSALKYDSYLVYPGTGSLPEVSGGGSILSQLKQLSELIGKIANGDITEIAADARDRLFVIEYIMDMFSHATYSNEAWYKRDAAANNNTMAHADKWDELKNTYKDKFGELDPTHFTDNISLTNQLISNKNNALYLGEVEYCLYGKATLKENLEASFGDIFKIRFASNILSGFINFWRYGDDKNNFTALGIETVADAIQGITQGIVPAPLTKTILILALATMESANDLEVIKKGLPVTFYKISYKQWKYAFNQDTSSEESTGSLGDNSKSDSKYNPEDSKGLFYSDYMYAFLVYQSIDNSMYTTLLNRIGKLVEGNMQLRKGGEWKLDNCIMYYQLQGQVKVEPLMLTIPIIQSFDANGRSAKDVIKTTKWAEFTIKQVKGYS
ncbi:MAG: Tad domain-containing protein [Solobacterium sp.]|nr:Tad domain-containing protein [Solobacterium sp.]